MTRHQLQPKQLEELRRLYGQEVEIIEYRWRIGRVSEIKDLIARHCADVVELVLPINLLARCFEPQEGITIPIIRAAMTPAGYPHREANMGFQYYERVVRIEIVTERL